MKRIGRRSVVRHVVFRNPGRHRAPGRFTLTALACLAAAWGVTSAAGCLESQDASLVEVVGSQDLDLGNGKRLWVFDVRGQGLEGLALQSLLISDGEAVTIGRGTFRGLKGEFSGKVAVLLEDARPFGPPGKKVVSITGEFLQSLPPTWSYNSEYLSGDMLSLGGRRAYSASAPAGEELTLLQEVFSPARAAAEPRLPAPHPVSKAQWQELTRGRMEVVLYSTISTTATD